MTMVPIDRRLVEAVQAGLREGAFCFTWCRNDDLREVARRFGADPGAGVWADPEELADLEEEHGDDLLQLTPAGEWTLAFQPHGFQGERAEVLEALSAGGVALSLFWHGAEDNRVIYAVDGDVLTAFSLADLPERSGSDPAALDERLEQVGHSLYALGNALSPSPVNAAYTVADEAFRIPRLSRTDVIRLNVLKNVADRIRMDEPR
ncbi:DUF6461 domain-containing protein [Streptosporangium canum]|uniref:DUF6461 domain-containing protein n=1 Tax=Streptosporangium canum TaxID=324952 RepID=UPI00343934AD